VTPSSTAGGKEALFGPLSAGLRDSLLKALNEIVRNFREGRWEPASLNGGKLCEAAYTVVRGFADGSYPDKPTKPANMVDACKDLERAGAQVPRSVRIQIPRMIVALYEIRNNRGVGHAGGDIDPNRMDAMVVISMAKWIVADLIRLLYKTDTDTATKAVESLCDRTVPIVWTVGEHKKVLNPSLTMKEKMLILLYSEAGPVAESALCGWVEYSNATVFRLEVIRPAHKAQLVHYDTRNRTVQVTPLGIKFVEDNLPLEIAA